MAGPTQGGTGDDGDPRAGPLRLFWPVLARRSARSLAKAYPGKSREAIRALHLASLGRAPRPHEIAMLDDMLRYLPGESTAAPVAGDASVAASESGGWSASLWVLVLANLVPVWGVVALGWEVFPLVVLFWLENVVVGVLNVARMLCAAPTDIGQWAARLFLVPFFCVHYGMFTAVHGVFVFALFGGDAYRDMSGGPLPVEAAQRAIAEFDLAVPALVLAGSHVFSFAWNFLARGEFRTATVNGLMMTPYGRIVVLHLTILFGGFAAQALGQPLWALLLLVAMKIALDAGAHRREHRQRFDAGGPPGQAGR